ncbi:MAG: oligosaccharide flippase family protein [bacterium]
MQNTEYIEVPAITNNTKNIFNDTLKIAPSKIIGTVANLLSIPLYTSLMGKSEYGLYSVAIAVLSFICILFSDWVGISALRFFSEKKNRNITEYLSSLFFLLFANLSVMYLIAVIFFKPISQFFQIPPKFLLAVLLIIIPVAVRALLFQILRAKIKALFYSISTIVNQFLTIAFAYYLLKTASLGSISIIIAMALSIFMIDAFIIFKIGILKKLKFNSIDFSLINSIFKYGLPVSLSSIGTWFILQGNKLVVQHFYGSSINGLYGVANNLTFTTLLTLFSILPLAAIPRIFIKHENNIDVRPIISKLTGFYLLVACPIIMLYCAFPKELVLLFSNQDYVEAYKLLPFLSLSCFFYSLTEYTALQYQIAKKTYIDTIIKLVPSVLILVLTPLFIKKLGISGIGISALLSNLVYFVLSLIVKVPSLESLPQIKTITNIALSALSSLVIVKLIYKFINFTGTQEYLVIIFLFITLYTAFVFLYRSLGLKTSSQSAE